MSGKISYTLDRTVPARAGDDWVLLEARTEDAGEDAWVTETVTLWDRDGVALATSTQLRTVLA